MRLELTADAGRDFEDILRFGIEHFGTQKALNYQKSLRSRFKSIAENPERYPYTPQFGVDVRRSVHRPHSIFYEVDGETVLILRILSRQNPIEALKMRGNDG